MLKWLKNLASNGAAASGAAVEEEARAGSAACKERGNALLSEGRLEEAAQSYREALSIYPRYAEASLNLGFVLKELSRAQEAQQYLQQALAIDPGLADAYYMLGGIAQGQGNLSEAIAHFERALQLKPDFEIVYRELCLALFQSGDKARAREVIAKGLEINPQDADFHYYLGNLHAEEREFEPAVACYLKALSIRPDDPEIHNNLGEAYKNLGRLDQAIASYQKAIRGKHDNPQTHFALAFAFQAKGDLDAAVQSYRDALSLKPDEKGYDNLAKLFQSRGDTGAVVECCQRIVELKPDNAEAHLNLGNALQAHDRLDAAAKSYQKAVLLNSGFAQAHNNLANVLQIQGKLDAAIERYRQTLLLKPDFAEAHYNLGNAFKLQGKLNAAVECYTKALSFQPGFAAAHLNLGSVLCDQGLFNESIERYREALRLRPNDFQGRSNLLYVLSFHVGCTAQEYLAEARRYGDKMIAKAQTYDSWPAMSSGSAVRRLRVGLVSGDFKMHPVGFFLEGILANLDPELVELIAYPTDPFEDEVTARLKPRFAGWHSIIGLSDQAAARQVHADGIHILIDLAGHTAHNRLPLFAWKPAPVQVSWLGYWASTGAPGMDYLLADAVSVPEAHRAHFTETVWYLPDTRLCFTPPQESAQLAVAPLPALRNGYLTFGCFQNLHKINDAVLAAWGKILAALPQARLRLQMKQLGSPVARDNLLQRLAAVGIAPERVRLEGAMPREAYLAAHAEVDIILDTFPYPGGTTTCEALWMGVPTLTLAGESALARQGAAMLACAGLPEWVAQDADQYVALALEHAGDLDKLAQLRAGLRPQVLASPLFDGERFARHLERALQDMWRQKTNPAE